MYLMLVTPVVYHGMADTYPEPTLFTYKGHLGWLQVLLKVVLDNLLLVTGGRISHSMYWNILLRKEGKVGPTTSANPVRAVVCKGTGEYSHPTRVTGDLA